MPDITMCKGVKCKRRVRCYRYMATPSNYQSFFMETPKNKPECDYFIRTIKDKRRRDANV